MKCKVTTLDNKSAGDIELSEEVFGLPERADILYRMVNWQLAKRRSGNHKVKVVNEINGSTRKISPQKGGGRARHSTRKAPQFRGGATTSGPHARDQGHGLHQTLRK